MAAHAATAAVAALLLICCSTWPAWATDHIVGGSSGWKLGVDYSTWTNGETFVVGDNLLFNYAAGVHTVSEVSESDFSTCSTSNALSSDSSGTTKIALKTSGKHFFVCGISGHCDGGMKIALNVVDNSATNSTGSSPATTTNGNTSDAVGLSSPAYATVAALLGTTTVVVLKLGLFGF